MTVEAWHEHCKTVIAFATFFSRSNGPRRPNLQKLFLHSLIFLCAMRDPFSIVGPGYNTNASPAERPFPIEA